MRVKADLKESGLRCSKPECETGNVRIQRHHCRHQAMWLGIWASRRAGEKKWRDFVDRYWDFKEKDCVTLCADHHAEIHQIYDRIIYRDLLVTLRPLAHYTWKQAEMLMDKLENACEEWLDKPSPGIRSEDFSKNRKTKRRPM